MTMDDTDGFSQSLIFYDIVIGRTATVQIYSGLDGGGTMLAQDTLPITPEAFGAAMTLSFSGNAQSVVFTGGNLQLALDNITFGAASVPEPAGWILLATRHRVFRSPVFSAAAESGLDATRIELNR